jgi:hypothetical protein
VIEHITPDRIANAIIQDKSFNGTYILVEGNNDYTLYRKFVNNDLCEVQIAFGKQNIIEAITILKARGYSNSIGILDSDFRNLEEQVKETENIFYTDYHDIETTILESEAFNSLIDNYCVEEKFIDFIKENNGKDIRSILLDLIAPLGYLKWANHQQNWGLLFKSKSVNGPELKIEDFIPVNTMQFKGYESMTNTVFNYSRGKVKIAIEEQETINNVELLSQSPVNYYQLCNGHDLSYLFALALRKKLASYNSKAILAEQIEKDLILAYDSRHFQETKLYSKLKHWERRENQSVLRF